MSSRLDVLIQFYQEDPTDPFNIYALAIEYMKSDVPKAKALFEKLLREHETYVPTYYHAAKLFQSLDDVDKAVEIYEKGIRIARAQNEAKAARELQSAYDELIF